MADDLAKKLLLSGTSDPPQQSRNNNLPQKRRFRRSKSAPVFDISPEVNKAGGLFPTSKFIFSNFRPSFRLTVSFLVIYLAVGVICFYLVRRQISGNKTNGFLDALYFCIVTMTTVGYGDLVPNSDGAKLLACIFVFAGMAIGALFLSQSADYLVEKQEILLVKALHIRRKAGEMQVLKEMETNRVKYKFLTTSAFLLVLILAGTVFLVKIEKLGLVDAFYCVCSTITTLGYGDKSFSTGGGRVFAVFWILTSTICVAQFFLYLAEMRTEQRQQSLVKWVLNRKMTHTDIEAADLDADGAVNAAEFIVFKLKEMGKISEDDIALVMEEFDHIDVDQSGVITNADIDVAQST